MPECHHCPLDGKGDPRCITCKGPPAVLSNHGRTVVSLDAPSEGAQGAAEALAAIEAQGRADDASGDDKPPAYADAFADGYAYGLRAGAIRLLQYQVDMDPDDLTLMMMAMRAPLAHCAKQLGLSRQALWARWQDLLTRHPELDGIVCAKEEIGLRRYTGGG